MQWFRTIPHVIRMLVVLFLVAQFAGVVPSPLTRSHSAPGAAVARANHHHAEDDRADGHRHDGCAYPDAGACKQHADYCCALHALFAGILSPATAVEIGGIAGETLRPRVSDVALGLGADRLDRPPRPLP